ncbi:MAG: DNA polymerase I [Patescibacteria group bacterium]
MKKPQKEPFMIIDGNALLHRAWHALPPLTTKKGEIVNAVYGFTMILLKALKDLTPTYAAVTFDRRAPTFRHEAFKEYKAKRVKQPQELYDQIDHIKHILTALHIPIFEKDGFEADDSIATICTYISQEDSQIKKIILSGDLDLLQLVDANTHLYTPKKGISDIAIYDEQGVQERYGIEPKQLLYFKALRGDQSDNIPGVKGIGEKTARELIQAFGSLDAIYDALERGAADSIKKQVAEKLKAQKKEALLSLSLVRLVHDVPIDFSIELCKLRPADTSSLSTIFHELEFTSLLSKLSELPGAAEAQPTLFQTAQSDTKWSHTLLSSQKDTTIFFKQLSQQTLCAVDTETTSLDALSARLIGISFCFDGVSAFYLPYDANAAWIPELKSFLGNELIKKIAHNAKYDMEVCASNELPFSGLAFDTMLAAYVLNPGVREYSLDNLALSEFGYQKIRIESLIGPKGKDQKSMSDVALEDITPYACEDAWMAFRLYGHYRHLLEKENLLSLLETIEVPLVAILCDMERIGIALDPSVLHELSKKVDTELGVIQKTIYSLAGKEFNINSPTQLKEILFVDLHISTIRIKKGKTGLSTAASELEKMRPLHPIIEHIIQHRELAKLKNTYIDVLPTLVNPTTKRVHTSFNQTIAATGRLSSSNPNLQNIPIRQEMGREIRKAFVAAPGYELLAADYSQLELRIVASLANDEKMIQAFREGKDIHRSTAAEMQGVSPEDVTQDMRRAAKEVNFGVLYGMGPQGLSQAAGISFSQAQDFIAKYFAAYPGVREYLDATISMARSRGFVETMFGRRRYVPEITSSVFQVRNAAERMAVNMPVQGSEADIIKLAMIAVYQDLNLVSNEDIRLLLQVHDELVFEVRQGCVLQYASRIRTAMEGVAILKAPLVIDMKTGPNWHDMKSL